MNSLFLDNIEQLQIIEQNRECLWTEALIVGYSIHPIEKTLAGVLLLLKLQFPAWGINHALRLFSLWTFH